jgi:phosphatidylethanolamine-binding protein
MVDIDLLYNGISVNMALLEPPQAAELPEIVISGASPDTLYTLIVTDPDAPTPSNPIRGQILHGVITNIANGAVSEGDVVTPYRGPGPPAGVHRYIFLLYEQPGEVQLPDYSAGENGRTGFNVTAYAQENGLGDPVAGAYFLSRPLL